MKRMNSCANAPAHKPINSEYFKRLGSNEATTSCNTGKESDPLTPWERSYAYPQEKARTAGMHAKPESARPQFTLMGVHDQKEYFHGLSSGLWSTGYFTELRSGSGELWQKSNAKGSQKGILNSDYRQ